MAYERLIAKEIRCVRLRIALLRVASCFAAFCLQSVMNFKETVMKGIHPLVPLVRNSETVVKAEFVTGCCSGSTACGPYNQRAKIDRHPNNHH